MTKLLSATICILLSACAGTEKAQNEYVRTPASDRQSNLKNMKVYQISDIEQKSINKILEVKGIRNITAEVRIVDPVTDPYGSFEAALKPIAYLVDRISTHSSDVSVFVPREVNYFTVDGHTRIASCYIYLYRTNSVEKKILINSRQCGVWPITKNIDHGAEIAKFFSGVIYLGPNFEVQNARAIDGDLDQSAILNELAKD